MLEPMLAKALRMWAEDKVPPTSDTPEIQNLLGLPTCLLQDLIGVRVAGWNSSFFSSAPAPAEANDLQREVLRLGRELQ